MATVIDKLVTILGYEVDDKGLTDAEKRLAQFQGDLDKLAGGFAVAGTALTAGLGLVGNSVLGFEKQINALSAATNASAEDMVLLRNQAKELGAQTAFSASQAAMAQTELGKAGLSTTDILQSMNGVLSLAAAGQLQMGEAASITTSLLASFQLETSESARIADVMAKAASSANTTVSEMGFALSKVAPIAQSLGLSLEETSAQLAVIQNNGNSAEIAGTGLKNVLLSLTKPSDEAAKFLRKAGLSTDFINKKIKQGKTIEVVKALGAANFDVAEATAIFGREAVSVALALANNTEKTNELTKSLEGAGGAAQEMADRQLAGLPGAVALLTSKFEALLLALGDAGVTGFLEAAANGLGNLAEGIANANPRVQRLISFVLIMGPALLGLAAAIKAVNFVIGAFNILFSASPFGRVVAGIGLVVTALGALYTFWDDIVNAFQKGFEIIGGIFDSVRSTLGLGEAEIQQNVTATPAGNVSPNVAPVTNNQSTNSIGIDRIEINAQGADSREIAQNIDGQLRTTLRNTAQNFDGQIAR